MSGSDNGGNTPPIKTDVVRSIPHVDRLHLNMADEIDRLRAALHACWDEYHELMPDDLHAQVKAALDIREFTAGEPC